MSPKNKVCLVLAYGQDNLGGLVSQTKARCDVATRLSKEGRINIIYLTCACEKANKGMAWEMKNYLENQGVEEIIILRPRGLNTAGEITHFLHQILKGEKLWVVSSWYHIPRVVWIFLTHGQLVRPVWTWACSWPDIWVEPVKLFKDVLTLGRDIKLTLLPRGR